MKRWLPILLTGVLALTIASAAFAQTTTQGSTTKPTIFTPEIPLPGFAGGPVTGTTIAQYIRAVFVYFIWIVGLMAVAMVVYGGIKWVAAAGNPGVINDARATINNAIIGLIIALTSVLLLNTINPDLTKFQGLTIQPTVQKLFIADLQQQAGSLAACTKSKAGGDPNQVCSGPTAGAGPNGDVTSGCLDLNQLVNNVALKDAFTGIDPFALKAIINIESPKQNGQPFSGPEGNDGPGYGIGQFKVETLKEVLKKVNGSLPPGCHEDQIYDADGTHISQSCKAWMDKRVAGALGTGLSGLGAQVEMISYYYGQQLLNQSCVKGDFLLAAAAYNQGLGGAGASFCSSSFLSNATPERIAEIKSKALEYINKFKTQYALACQNGV